MVDVKDVMEVIEKHSDAIGPEGMTELQLALIEKDVAMDMSEIDRLTGELQAERDGRAADKTAYDEKIKDFSTRMSRFIKGENPWEGEKEEVVEETVEETAGEDKDDFYERMYGKENE